MKILKNFNLLAISLLVIPLVSGCAPTTMGNAGRNPPLSMPHPPIQFTNAPAIVMQSGLGDGKEAWDTVAPTLSQEFSVVTFDRPGRSEAPPTQAPRDPCTIASEQRAMLQSMNLKPPYILVGHSLGGLYQYTYSKLYPSEVAGLVLIDPTPPHHWETMQNEAPEAALMIQGLRWIAFSETDRREFDAQSVCLDRITNLPSFPIPTTILVAGKFTGPGEEGDFETMTRKSRQIWTPLTGGTPLYEVQDSGHYIQKDSPDAVISAVRHIATDLSVPRQGKLDK